MSTTPSAPSSAPPKRRRLSADERRSQLVGACVEVLDEAGFRGTTADAIAQRAGVSKGLLWHYFDDLDDLLETTARQTLATLASAVGERIDLAAPVPELIRSAVHAAAELRLTHGSERRAMNEIIVNLRSGNGTLRLGPSDLAPLHEAQAAIFRRGQAEGDVRRDLDPHLLAVTYQGAVDTMLGHLDAFPDADAAAHADTVVDVLLGGMGTTRGPSAS